MQKEEMPRGSAAHIDWVLVALLEWELLGVDGTSLCCKTLPLFTGSNTWPQKCCIKAAKSQRVPGPTILLSLKAWEAERPSGNAGDPSPGFITLADRPCPVLLGKQ